MLPTVDHNMERAIRFFVDQAQHAPEERDRRLHEHLQTMAAAIQENRRLLDYLQTRLDEVQDELKSH